MKHGSHWLALALCVGTCPVVVAQDDDRDVTMTVIEDEAEATERDFVQDIELPEPARGREAPGRSVAEEAHEGGERGNERASEARQQEDERGRSDEAREGEQGGRPDDPGRPSGGGDQPGGGNQPGDGGGLPDLPQ